MKVAIVSGSPRREANTRIMMQHVREYCSTLDHEVLFIDLADDGMDYFRGFDRDYSEATRRAAAGLMGADVWLIGSPVYNSFFSAALKNIFEFLDYKKTGGKTAGLAIMAAGGISFTGVQSLLTQMMSYFGIITNPKAVHMTADAIRDGRVGDADSQKRLTEMVDRTLKIAAQTRSEPESR